MSDVVNHPPHYAEGWSNGAEVIDITEHLNFNRGNAVKYIARAGKKDQDREIEDLQKAKWYLDRELYRLGVGQRDPILDAQLAQNGDVPQRILFGYARTWDRIEDVPEGVHVYDKDGGEFWWRDDELMFDGYWWEGGVGDSFNDDLGPFTKVQAD